MLGVICFVCAHVCDDDGCDGLNMLGPWDVALLGGALSVEVCHCVKGLRGLLVLKLCPVRKRVSSWLSLDQDIEPLASPAPGLPA